MSNIDFNQIKQRILPYFIEVYGEEFRDTIIEKMNHIEPIFYHTIEGKKAIMYTMQSAKRVELTIKFLENNHIFLPEELKSQMIKMNGTSRINEVPEAENLLKACFGAAEYRDVVWEGIRDIPKQPTDREYIKIQSVETLKKLGIFIEPEDFNQWLLSEEAKQVFAKIDQLSQSIVPLDHEYREFDRQFEELKSLIEKSNELERNLCHQYMIEFVNSIEQYTNEHDKQSLEQYLHSDKKDWYAFEKTMDIFKIVGNSLYGSGIIEAFGKKADEKLKDLNSSHYTKKTIMEDRIKYFKLIGVYRDQCSPEEFLATKEAMVHVPNQTCVEDIIAKKEHFAKKVTTELLRATSSYNDNIDQIDSLHLLDSPDFSIETIRERMICIYPSVRMAEGQAQAVAVLCFSPENCLPNYIDTMFIHEVNHAVELSLLHYDKKPLYKCGFEFLDDDETAVRKYEAFSEIINQMIAMEITEAMHRDGVYLFDNPNTSKVRGGTSYEQQRILIDEFWNNFKKEILSARVASNLDSFYATVGEDNFQELNDLINEYRALPFYMMMNDVINKRTTELTMKRTQLLNRSCEILKRMSAQAKPIPGYENFAGKVV